MSQEKVEYKKQLKANRKKINRQKKIQSALMSVAIVLVICLAIGWVGYSFQKKRAEAKAEEPAERIAVDNEALADYMSSLDATEEEDASMTETDEEVEASEDEGDEDAEEAE